VYVPSGSPDGLYALNLQIAPFDLDASPSRPVLFPLRDSNRKG
jgi:arylformamidase